MRLPSTSTLLRTVYTISSASTLVGARQNQQALQAIPSRVSPAAYTYTFNKPMSLFSMFSRGPRGDSDKSKNQFPDTRSDQEWRESIQKKTPSHLATERFNILRNEGTESPGSSPYTGEFGTKPGSAGIFKCAGCDTPLYSTKTKFDSPCGWPAFYEGLPGKVGEGAHNDGSSRNEIWCTNCGGHLGHVFRERGLMEEHGIPKNVRHCVNGLAMDFEREGGKSSKA